LKPRPELIWEGPFFKTLLSSRGGTLSTGVSKANGVSDKKLRTWDTFGLRGIPDNRGEREQLSHWKGPNSGLSGRPSCLENAGDRKGGDFPRRGGAFLFQFRKGKPAERSRTVLNQMVCPGRQKALEGSFPSSEGHLHRKDRKLTEEVSGVHPPLMEGGGASLERGLR